MSLINVSSSIPLPLYLKSIKTLFKKVWKFYKWKSSLTNGYVCLGTSEHGLANDSRRFGWARGIDRAANAGEAGTSLPGRSVPNRLKST